MGTDPRIDRVMPVLGRAVARMEIPAVEKISEDSKNDAFQVLVSTMLSAQTKDAVTHAASMRLDRKSTRLNSSHVSESRMPSSA